MVIAIDDNIQQKSMYLRVVRNLFTLAAFYEALRMLFQRASSISTVFLPQKSVLKTVGWMPHIMSALKPMSEVVWCFLLRFASACGTNFLLRAALHETLSKKFGSI